MKIAFMTALAFTLYLTASASFAGVVDATDKTYYDEVVRTYQPVVLEFWAPWCHVCRDMAPIVNTLAGEYSGKVKFVRINTDDNPDAARKYGVDGIPAFFYIKDGYTAGSAVGGMSKEKLKERLGLE